MVGAACCRGCAPVAAIITGSNAPPSARFWPGGVMGLAGAVRASCALWWRLRGVRDSVALALDVHGCALPFALLPLPSTKQPAGGVPCLTHGQRGRVAPSPCGWTRGGRSPHGSCRVSLHGGCGGRRRCPPPCCVSSTEGGLESVGEVVHCSAASCYQKRYRYKLQVLGGCQLHAKRGCQLHALGGANCTRITSAIHGARPSLSTGARCNINGRAARLAAAMATGAVLPSPGQRGRPCRRRAHRAVPQAPCA